MTKSYVAYYRVSTQRQGESGLGLEAQERAVLLHVNGHGVLLAAYQEIESGRKRERPELFKALAHAKRSRATLVIAKLDRLARNVAFTSALMESGVDFVACDMPQANKLTIHILAAVAEAEADTISQRTKAALASYKARGGRLGSHDPRCPGFADGEFAAVGSRANQEKAKETYADLLPIMLEWRGSGLSLRSIAGRLNGLGQTTRGGKSWNPVQVKRILDRYATA